MSAYTVVLALHIMAVIAAFGVPLGYPLLIPYVRRRHPEALPGLHEVQLWMNQRVTGTGTVLVLAFGIYLATKGHHWGELWVGVPLAIIVVIGGVGGAVINPAVRKMIGLAAAGGPEYEAVYKRYMQAEVLLGVLVLVAIFFMAAKPG